MTLPKLQFSNTRKCLRVTLEVTLCKGIETALGVRGISKLLTAKMSKGDAAS